MVVSKSGIDFATALFMKADEARDTYEKAKELGEGYFDDEISYRHTIRSLERAIGIFDRSNKKPKAYDIYYIIKADRRQSVHCMTVVAGNVNDAKTIVDYAVLRQTDHCAFSKSNGKLPSSIRWDVMAERDGVSVEEIMAKAKNGGYTFA